MGVRGGGDGDEGGYIGLNSEAEELEGRQDFGNDVSSCAAIWPELVRIDLWYHDAERGSEKDRRNKRTGDR